MRENTGYPIPKGKLTASIEVALRGQTSEDEGSASSLSVLGPTGERGTWVSSPARASNVFTGQLGFPWNTFFDQRNQMELSNRGVFTSRIRISVFQLQATEPIGVATVRLSPGKTIVYEPALPRESYGLILLEQLEGGVPISARGLTEGKNYSSFSR